MTETIQSLLRARAAAPDHVLFQEMNGNAALLNLDTETYFGLDEVGVRMWHAMSEAENLAAAARALADVYDAPLATLETDLVELAVELKAQGLLILDA